MTKVELWLDRGWSKVNSMQTHHMSADASDVRYVVATWIVTVVCFAVCFLNITSLVDSDARLFRSAAAQTSPQISAINVRTFRPTVDALGLISVERSVALSHLKLNLSLMIDSERDGLTQRFSGRDFVVLNQATTGQFSLALGLWGRLTLGLSLPLHIVKSDLDGPNGQPILSDDGLGDGSFSLKGVIYDSAKSPVGLAILVHTYWSLATPLPLLSDQSKPLVEPLLIVDSEWSRVALAFNVGYRMRNQGSLAPIDVREDGTTAVTENPIRFGPELSYRTGISFYYVPRFLHHCFELIGGTPVGVEGGALRAQHLEVLSGLKLIFNRGSFLTIGGARGLIDSYTQPMWRVFMGITFHPKAKDSDRDGIINDLDDCPSHPEDIDGFEDKNGCPDPDNDNDGLLDLYDQCPNDPEDFNKFEDADGCPDAQRDVDRDGIVDNQDDCPNQAEDRDGFNDADGCPDPDNDQDGVLDTDDRCPNRPEDGDGYQDADGCPDPDNDQDGIADTRDRCPDIPEDLDGDADQDGCPEKSSTMVTDQGERLEIKGKVFFDLNKASIKAESHKLLLEIAQFLNQRPDITLIEVQGHTDSQGSRRYNLDLSARRAAAVRDFLMRQGFVEAQRLKSKGYGPDQPLVSGNTPEAYAQNRRVEFVVLSREK